jgi:hypothetical protein
MKKILLLAILAISINAFPQTRNLAFNYQYSTLNSADQDISLIQMFDSIITWVWDAPGNEWQFYTKYVDIIYDADKHETSRLRKDWTGSAWENGEQFSYIFDESNNLTIELYEYWDNNTWVFKEQYSNTYDENNNLTSRTWKNWTPDIWYNLRQ